MSVVEGPFFGPFVASQSALGPRPAVIERVLPVLEAAFSTGPTQSPWIWVPCPGPPFRRPPGL